MIITVSKEDNVKSIPVSWCYFRPSLELASQHNSLSNVNSNIRDSMPFIEVKSKPRRVEEEPSIWTDFVQNTSLLGIQHFLRNKSIVWLVAYLACVAMSIFQSWTITVQYFEQHTYQTSHIVSKNDLPFPSVTVCSNTVLKESFDFSLIPGFNTSVPKKLENCTDANIRKQWYDVRITNRRAAIMYIRKLPKAERESLAIDIKKEFITWCRFDGQPCNYSDPKDFFFFNHPYFGNCFTFNPAFEKIDAKQQDLNADLLMQIKFQPSGYWFPFDHDPKAQVRIHAPGTAPLMEAVGVTQVSTWDRIILEMELTEVVSIKKIKKGVPSCVDRTDEAYRRRSRYYASDRPYRYSLQACIASCTQDYAGEECSTISQFLPVQSAEYEKNKTTDHYCRIVAAINMETCNCPPACDKAEYAIATQRLEDANVECANDNHDGEEGNAIIIIKFRRNIYQKIEEKFCYSVADFLGALGGNIGLWIGLCVISLLELVELGVKLAVQATKKSRKTAPPYAVNPFMGAKRRQINRGFLTLKFGKNIYDKVEEQFCYTVADYLGVLGGNISLWIGLCIISLLELVELGIKLAVGAMKKKPRKTALRPILHQPNKLPRRFIFSAAHVPVY